MKKSKWISVKEKMPEDGIFVLAIDTAKNQHVARYFSMASRKISWSFRTHYRMYGSITHWMPLPKPPEDL